MNVGRRRLVYVITAFFTAVLFGYMTTNREIDHNIMAYNGTEEPQTASIRIALDGEQILNERLTVDPGSRSKIASIVQPGECQIVVDSEADRYTEKLSLPPNGRYDSRSYTNINFTQNHMGDEYVEFRSYVLD